MKHQLVATSSVHNGYDRLYLVPVVNLTAAPVMLCAGTKLGTIIPLLENYDVKATARSYSTVVSRQSKAQKLQKILNELKFGEMLRGHPNEKKLLRESIERNLDAFASDDTDIGKVSLVEHVIDTQTSMPIKCRQRQYSVQNRKAIDEEVQKYKAIDVVRAST